MFFRLIISSTMPEIIYQDWELHLLKVFSYIKEIQDVFFLFASAELTVKAALIVSTCNYMVIQ